MSEALFRLGFATLFAHELDAVARAEWRVLPLTSFLPESVAYPVFVLAHIPLMVWLLFLIGHREASVRRLTRLVLSGFLVLHVALHLAFSGHVHYDFHGWLSKTLIFGGGVLGALYLALEGRARERIA